MKTLLITIATLLLIGCGGGSDSDSGGGTVSPYAGIWDFTNTNSSLTGIDVFSISNSGVVTAIEPYPNCSGVDTSNQIVGNTFSTDEGAGNATFTVTLSKAVTSLVVPAVTYADSSAEVATENDSYFCTIDGVRCSIRESGTVTFTSNTTASGSVMGILSCEGINFSITASVRGTKR